MDYQVNYGKKPRRSRALLLGIFIGLLILGAATEAFVAYKLAHEPTTLGIQTSQPSTNGDKLSLPAKPGLESFISQKYSYGFYYQPAITNPDGSRAAITIAELDGGLVLSYDDQTHQPARLLEAFGKDAGDSLNDALKKQFWNGVSPTGCKIDNTPNPDDPNISDKWDLATLSAPATPPAASASASPKANCPVSYTKQVGSGPRFFLMDPQHPSVYLFIEAGLNPIPAGKSDSGQPLSWFDTITFLK